MEGVAADLVVRRRRTALYDCRIPERYQTRLAEASGYGSEAGPNLEVGISVDRLTCASIYAIIHSVKVTLDTNILYQALYSSAGASHEILRMVRLGTLQMAVSVPVFEEYRSVLLRSKTIRETGLLREELEKVLDFIALIGVATPIDYLWRPNLRDEADNMFVELAVASGSEYLITRNVRDYTIENELLLDSFDIVTPPMFLTVWRTKHGE